MIPLGLVARVRTQSQGLPIQEVHHCATHVIVAYQEKNVRMYKYGLNTKAVNLGRQGIATQSRHLRAATEQCFAQKIATRAPAALHVGEVASRHILESSI